MMKAEIRADGLHIEGYVNVPGRKSKPLQNETRGEFIEEIEQRAFQRAIDRAKSIDMLIDHEPEKKVATTENNTLEVYEDEVGLRAVSVITDADVINDARQGKLRGWSFDMKNIVDEMEERAKGLPIRHVKDFDMSEISLIINKVPCYQSTSVEVRAGETVETRATETPIEVKEEPAKPDYTIYEKQIELLKNKAE